MESPDHLLLSALRVFDQEVTIAHTNLQVTFAQYNTILISYKLIYPAKTEASLSREWMLMLIQSTPAKMHQLSTHSANIRISVPSFVPLPSTLSRLLTDHPVGIISLDTA